MRGVTVGSRSMFVRELAMFDGRSCMLLRLFVLAEIVMMGRLMVMVRGSEPEDGKVRFVNLTLEDVIETIRLSDPEHADALHHRYCDFWLVDAALELNAPTFGLARSRMRQRRKPVKRADGSAVTPIIETMHSGEKIDD